MLVYGNKKSQLLGTAQDDIFYPSGYVGSELTLNPGNDTYNLVDPAWYDFWLTPANYFTSTGARLNLGTSAVVLGGVSVKANGISDGYSGTDTINFSQDPINYSLRIHSSPYDDYLNTVGSAVNVEWRVFPGSGNDNINVAFATVWLLDFPRLDLNFSSLNGRVQADSSTSVTYSFRDNATWIIGGQTGLAKIVNTAPRTYIQLQLNAYTTQGQQTLNSVGNNIGVEFQSYKDAVINIPGLSGVLQVDSKTTLNYKVDPGYHVDWCFSTNAAKITGSSESEYFTFNGGSSATITGGGGTDYYYINPSVVALQINDYNFEDKLYLNILGTIDRVTVAKSISLSVNKSNYTTTIAIAASASSPAANVVVNGWYTNYQFNASDKTIQLIPLQATDTAYLSYFNNGRLYANGGLDKDGKSIYLTNIKEILSFDASRAEVPDKIYYYEPSYDHINLSNSSYLPTYTLLPGNFRSGSDASTPSGPSEYVIYDTNTGNVYFDQDGTGPSPTLLAATFVDKPVLQYTDFTTPAPQSYELSAAQEKVNEGQSAIFTLTTANVPAGTSLAYTLSGKGITAADVMDGQLSGNAVVDAAGKATITVPLLADGVVEGAETLTIAIAGQQQSVSVLDPVSTFYGDGKSQLLGTLGDDIFYPSGNVFKELSLSAGNDTYYLGASSYAFSLGPMKYSATSGVAINLSDKAASINGFELSPFSIADGFGYNDSIKFTGTSKPTYITFYSGPFDDYLVNSNESGIFWNFDPKSGRDSISSSSGGLYVTFSDFNNANIKIPGISGKIQIDSSTSLTYSGAASWWSFQEGTYNVSGSNDYDGLNFWNSSNNPLFKDQTVSGGGGGDNFVIVTGGINLRVLDFNVDDMLSPNLLGQFGQATLDKAAVDKSISLTLNKADYTTTVNFASTFFPSGSSYIVNGFYSSYSFNNGSVSLIPISASDPNYASYFNGTLLVPTMGTSSLNNQTLRLNDSGELISFPVQSITAPDRVYNFESGKDQIHLWRTDNILGGSASYPLSAANFLAADGAKAPTKATQYVIYDTSTGNLYFDQDGTGPSPTVLAATMADKATLRYTDFKISTPQSYDVSTAISAVDEGQSARFTISASNVLAGTTVSYTLSGKGISIADLGGASLSGTATIDANGAATVVVPTTADNLIEGAETLQLSIQGKTASVVINDSSRPSAINPANAVTYQLTANFSTMLEGSLAEFTLRTNNLPPGAQVAYTVSGLPASVIDSTKLSGIATLDGNGSALIQVPILADGARAQGSQSVTLNVQNYSASIPISDSSPEMGNWSGNKIVEYLNAGSLGSYGPQRTIYMASDPELLSIILNKSYPAVYFPKLMGFKSGVDLLHFVDDDVYANGNTGIEFLKLQNWLAGPGFTQPKSATDNVIYDTNTKTVYFDLDGTGPAPTTPVLQIADGAALSPADIQIQHPVLYALSAQSTTNFLISANNYTATSIPYTISGLSAAEVVGGMLSGTVTLGADKTAVISVPLAANVVNKTITVSAAGLSASSTLGGTTVLTPTYSVAASASAVNEGASATFLITTTNVASGTSLGYALSGAGITASDVVGGQLSGTTQVNASGAATVTVNLSADGITEGPEVLMLTVAGKTASIVINDSGGAKSGTASADSLSGTIGSDTIDGGAGVDTVFYGGNLSAYTLNRGTSTWTVSSFAEGVDTLANVERLHFADQSLALDLGSTQSAGQAAMLLGAVLPGKLALDPSKQALMGAVIGLFDQGYSLTVLAGALLRLDIWTILTGSSTNQAIANYLLSNVNGTAPSAAALSTAVSALNSESVQGTWLGALAAGSAGQSHIGLSALAQTGLAYVAPETLAASAASMDEGGTVTFSMTTNLATGTALAYTLYGAGVSGADIAGGQLSATVPVGAYGQVTVPVTLLSDGQTEGPETLVFTSRGLSVSVLINDISVAATPTYAISSGAPSVNEGGTVSFTVTTTNVAAGTVVPYTLSGAGITASDILGGQLSGNAVVTQSGAALIAVSIAADSTTEGPETLVLSLAGKSAQIVVNDTSMAPATYQIVPSALAVNGGDTLVVTLKTTNLVAGTHVPYTLNVPMLDIVGGALSGEFIVDASGLANITIATTQHQTTDTMIINVFDQHQPVTLVGVKGG